MLWNREHVFDKAQLSPAPLTTLGQSWCLRSPADKSCPETWAFPTPALADGRNLTEGQRELSMNDKITVLPGCVKAHTRAVLSSCRAAAREEFILEEAAQLLSLVLQ